MVNKRRFILGSFAFVGSCFIALLGGSLVQAEESFNEDISLSLLSELPEVQPVDELPEVQPVDELPEVQPVDELPEVQPVDELPEVQPVDELPEVQSVNSYSSSRPAKYVIRAYTSYEPLSAAVTIYEDGYQGTLYLRSYWYGGGFYRATYAGFLYKV